jgi:hypothetical protein
MKMKLRIPRAFFTELVTIQKASTVRDAGGGISGAPTILQSQVPAAAKNLNDADTLWAGQFADFNQWQVWLEHLDTPQALNNTCELVLADGRLLKVRQVMPRGDRHLLVLALEVQT